MNANDYARTELCEIIINYVENNDPVSKEIIVKNKALIIDEGGFRNHTAYRFWKFSNDKMLELLFGYGIRVTNSGLLSYYKTISNTPVIVNALLDANPISLVEQGDKLINYYDVCGFVAKYGESSHKEVMKRFVKESELFRFDEEDYFIKLDSNIKFFIFSKELLRRCNCPLRVGNLILKEQYVLVDTKNERAIDTLRGFLKDAFINRQVFKLKGINYFPDIMESYKPKTKIDKISEKVDYITPGGGLMIKVKISE